MRFLLEKMDCAGSVISSGETKGSQWTAEEHQSFLRAYEAHGKDWRKVKEEVGTRTITQVRSHAQKYFLKLKRHSKKAQTEQPFSLLAPLQCPVARVDPRLEYQNSVMRRYIQTMMGVNMAFAGELGRMMQGNKAVEDLQKSLQMAPQTFFCYQRDLR